jgi:glucokinase
MSQPLIAVDLGGTSLRAALFAGNSPQPERHKKTSTQADKGPDHVFRRIIKTIEAVLPESTQGLRIGVGAPGPIDPYEGVVIEAPNLPGWKDVPLQAKLQSHFDCPVRLGNDANVAGLGEWRHGAGKQANPMLYMTISTGIGGGVIQGGEIMLGQRGLAAEFGHITVEPGGPVCGCGQHGHLEAVAAGPAIARMANARLDKGAKSSLAQLRDKGRSITAIEVGRAANEDDPLALEIIQQTGETIGLALASLLHVFNPQTVVLGGGVSLIGQPLFDSIEHSLHQHVMHPAYLQNFNLVPAALGDDAGLVGAMVLAASA